MPYRRRFTQRRRMAPIINSIKNVVDTTASTGTTIQQSLIAKAVNTPASTTANDVSNGCIIKAIWCSVDVCGLAATGVLQRTNFYIMKNPGDNLTEPSAFAVGTSNEKKFVFKQWQVMTMRNQDGNVPFHWEGWIKIPRRYQRMGTDDTISLSFMTDAAAGHFSAQFIYKWYR